MKYYNFEIYTLNPETLETGWDIEFVSVKAKDIDEATEKITQYPLFDCIILYNRCEKLNETSEFLQYDGNRNMEIIKRI